MGRDGGGQTDREKYRGMDRQREKNRGMEKKREKGKKRGRENVNHMNSEK